MESWIQSVFGPGFRVYSRFFVVSRSIRVACFVCRLGFALVLHVTENGWHLGNTEMMLRTRSRMAEQENRVHRIRWLGRSCGGKTAPTTTQPRI